jgi:hypothetical protein
MTPILRFSALLLLLACGGCVTDEFMPVSFGGMSVHPNNEAAQSEQGKISIVRSSDDVSYMSAAASVEINGKEVATLAHGRSYAGHLPPGPATIKVSAWDGIPGMASRLPSGSTTYKFNVEAGKSYSFIISPRREEMPHDVLDGTKVATEGRGGPFQIAAQ